MQRRERTAAVPSRRQEGMARREGLTFPRSMENNLVRAAGRQREGPGPGRFITGVVQPVCVCAGGGSQNCMFSWCDENREVVVWA